MKHAFKTLVGATAFASVVFAAGTASATDAACHTAIVKNLAKYQATLAKNMAGCHKSRSGGKLGASVNCNLASGANSSDTKGKVGGAVTKLKAAIDKACAGANLATFQGLYPRCPSPAANADGPNGIDSFLELENCLVALSDHYVGELSEQVLGAPASTGVTYPLAKGLLSCQGGIGKAFAKAIKTVGGEFQKCQAAQEKANPMDLTYSACKTGGFTSGKAQAALDAVGTAILSSCAPANVPTQTDWAKLNMCGQSQANMTACAITTASNGRGIMPRTAVGLISAMMGFPNDGMGNLTCAYGADVVINAGHESKISATDLDSGYTGLSHNVDVVDRSIGGVKLQNCNADCENCEVRIDPTNGYCRCSNDNTTKCDVVNGPDATHCGGNNCNCYFGPPLPLNASNTPVCVVNKFAGDFTGSTQEVGSYDVFTRTKALVYLGISQVHPCPVCVGDGTANDGTKSGTCQGGANNGNPCDVNAKSATFGDTSFDCFPPAIGANISGTGLALNLEFKSGSTTMLPTIAAGANCAAGTCFCSECTGNLAVACNSDADCTTAETVDGVPSGTYGTCGVNQATLGATPLPRENSCSGPTATDCVNEQCSSGPFDTYCSGYVRGNGNGILGCASDTDCENYDCDGNGTANDPVGECGTCSVNGTRGCFNHSGITATGTPGIFNSVGVSTFCSAATSNSGVNSVGGLPGPGRVKLDFDFKVWCDSAHATVFNLPLGQNCP